MTPRPRIADRTEDAIWATYRGHSIHCFRDSDDAYERWYIIVAAPSGSYAYDGWWADSQGKSADEAVQEAIRGACIAPRAATATKEQTP